MNELGLVHHTVQFNSHFPSVSNIRPIQLISLVQLFERELNYNSNDSKHRIILMSDKLLHIDNQHLRISIESDGDIDVAWTLNVCNIVQYVMLSIFFIFKFLKAIHKCF